MNIRNIMKMTVSAALLGALALGAGSCGIYNKYKTPDQSPVAKAYAEAKEAPYDSTAFGNMQWEKVFTDPMLKDLIGKALAHNANYDNALLNVKQAQAQLKGARLAYLPSVAIAPQGNGSSFDGSKLGWTYSLPAQVSWEIDVFGKLLNNKRAAQAGVWQAEAYGQAVRSQIIASVANTYYSIAATKAQLKLSRNTAEIWRQSVQTMKDLKESGRVTEAAVVQSTANYYSILGSVTDLETAVVKLNNVMSLLVDEMPGEGGWNVPETAAFDVPAIMRETVPMRELAMRPDVAAAEQSLAVAFYQTNSARAAFYPGLSVTFNGGFTNSAGSMIINPGKWFYNLGASLVAPLFSRGKNIATLEAAKAAQQIALNNFEYSIMSASAEVSNAMTIYQKSTEKQDFLKLQVENLEKSVDYTQDLLKYGTNNRTTYLEVLTAQQSLLSAQISQINCDLARAQAIINLYQALGGGR